MSDEKQKSRGFLGRLVFFLKLVEIRLRFVALLVVTALAVGYWDTIQNYIERWQRTHRAAMHEGHAETAPSSDFEWFCPMHPFVLRDRFDKCPICGMNLVERRKTGPMQLPEGVLTRVQVSPDRILQAGVQIEAVAYRLLTRTLRAYGTIEMDETRVAKIIARFPGRVEELMVNATGLVVKTGEPLARIYSPRFLSAIQEYLQALTSQREAEKSASAAPDAKRRAQEIADYARRRLALAGFTDAQLDEIASSGKASESVTFHSPLAGTVVEKNVLLGQMVDEGTTLYTIADLSTLWIQAQVVESEIGLVRPGMSVQVEAVAHPGEVFYGTVDFIYPTLNTETRSVKVRVVVGNPDGRLKPGMYVAAVIRAPIGRYGRIGTPEEPKADETMATTMTMPDAAKAVPEGKYFCPMHPEVVSDKPGDCPKCGMALVLKSKGKAADAATTAAVAAAPFKLPTRKMDEAKAFLDTIPVGGAYYVCPMDPQAVSTRKDNCPICGMPLEEKKKQAPKPGPITADTPSAERWAEGYACAMHLEILFPEGGPCAVCPCAMEMTKWRIERQLSIPETAVIDTGNRQIVYVEAMPGVYDARAVTLGPRAGAYFPLVRGLSPGNRIVTRGSFLIDAEARLNPAAVSAPVGETATAATHQGGASPESKSETPAEHKH